MDFPTLYIYLNEVDDTKADEYVRLLQMITNVAILSDLISISINHIVIIVNCHFFQAKC